MIIVAVACALWCAWRAAYLRERAADRLASLVQAGIMVKAMLEGHRPVVTVAPRGKTMAEAQAEIDRIWATLQFEAKPGAGGAVNR